MARLFAHHGAYVDEVALLSSDRHDWPGLRLALTSETSNDLLFTRTARNALTLEMTGTSRHLTVMDGIVAERPTEVDDICRMPEGISARFAWDVTGRQNSIVVAFSEELLSTYAPERFDGRMAHGSLMPRDYAPAPALSALIRLLARELEPDEERGPLYADMVIRLLAIEICETAWTRRPKSVAGGAGPDRRMRRALDFIASHLGAPLSLRDLATASGISISLLAKLFVHHTGSSPHAYIIGKRVERARQLLQATDMPIAQVATEVGFADQSHLTKALKRLTGQTPGRLRPGRGRSAGA